MTGGPKRIAIWSPKGGVGKTVLAAAIALKLAEDQPTVLVDGNADNPDVVTLLQCPGYPNVTGWVEPADPGDVYSLLVRHSNRLWVLPGPPRYVEEGALSGQVMESILDTCTRAGMVVVADLSASLRDSTVAALDRADEVLIPVTLDLLSLAPIRRLYRELDLMRLPKSKFKVVINRHTNTREITAEDVRSFSEFPVVGSIPSSRDLAAAVNRGEAAAALAGDSPVGRAVARIVEPFRTPGAAGEDDRRRHSLAGMLSGLWKGAQ